MEKLKQETAKELREKFQQDLTIMQETCTHSDISDWMDQWWAPGHSTGNNVRVCNICEKIIHYKSCCGICGKELIDDERKTGDGHKLVWGPDYCEDDYNLFMNEKEIVNCEFQIKILTGEVAQGESVIQDVFFHIRLSEAYKDFDFIKEWNYFLKDLPERKEVGRSDTFTEIKTFCHHLRTQKKVPIEGGNSYSDIAADSHYLIKLT